MHTFLLGLRKRLNDAIHWLRAFALRFAKRSQLAEGRHTRPQICRAAPAQSIAHAKVGLDGVPPTGPTTSSAAEVAFAQRSEPEAGLTPNVATDRARRPDAASLESDSSQREAVWPAAANAPGASLTGRQRVGTENEAPASEEPLSCSIDRKASPGPEPTPDEGQVLVLGVTDESTILPPREEESVDATTVPDSAAEIVPRPEAAMLGGAELPSGNAVEAAGAAANESMPPNQASETPAQRFEKLSSATSEAPLSAAGDTTFESEPGSPLNPPSEPPMGVRSLEQREKIKGQPVVGGTGARDGGEAGRRLVQDGSRSSRPPPESYEQPFVDSRVTPLPDEYALWNLAVVRHLLLVDAPKDEAVYLTITPRVLASALSEVSGDTLAPDEAEARFVDVVSAMYHARVLPHPRKLQVLRRCGGDGLPECGAFLAVSVLAAYMMRTDEGAVASAYYKRLAEVLRCGLSGGLPRGFDPDEFEGLWLYLRAWLNRDQRRQLAMPGPDVSLRRYVALPLTHVPLRRVDIERLPDFFDWAGYGPGEHVAIERVTTDISQWSRARGGFTVSGMDALHDDRRPAVLAQIAHELECWDGSLTDAQGRRTASVEVFLHWERRLPVLSYLPRRPAVFPATFDDGVHILDAGQEGWYEPFPIDVAEGGELRSGFAWDASVDGIHFVLRRTGADVIAMAPSEFDGPVSHGSLTLGAPGAVLCADSVAERVRLYLESVTGKRCTPVAAPSAPAGWQLITGVNPVRRLQPPDGLETLAVAPNVDIVFTGGLRLGRRWAWLAGAPPNLVVTGLESSEPILIDGDPVHADQEGVIQHEGRLTRPGVHLVQVGRVRRRLEIVPPDLEASAVDVDAERVRHYSTAVALPQGFWTIIGARVGEVVHATSGRWGYGTLISCAFEPVWAVSFGGGPGAVVRSLTDSSLPPTRANRRIPIRDLRASRAWADAVYGAHIRRPRFCSPATSVDWRTYAVWSEYVSIAREIKRVLKSGRR